MTFARKIWRLLVAVKDGLALLFLLLFFGALYAVLMLRPSAGGVRDGALLLKLNGAVVEEPAKVDPLAMLTGGGEGNQYRARDVVRALDAAAKDDGVKAVVLDLSSFGGGGLVHMQAIGAALDRVKAAKKPVLSYAGVYTDDGVMLAAHASEAWVDPLGGALVLGPGGKTQYYGALLERLKIDAKVFKVGTYKDYVEPYIRNDMSAPSREARVAIYDAIFGQWKADVAKARPRAQLDLVTKDPVGYLKAANNDGAQAALKAGLVDKVGDRATFGQRVADIVGKDTLDERPGAFPHSTLKAYLAAHAPQTPGKAIGVVTVAGEIVDGDAGPGTAGGDRIAALLDSAKAKDLAGLVIRVDSPGGSVAASERIREAVLRQKGKKIPVAVSMANVAASGGYWVSTPGARIFAEPGTVTGSIGIFAVIPTFERALAGWGVTSDGVRTTPLSGQPDVLGGLTPEGEALLQGYIENGYARFIGLVAQARGKTPEQIDTVAQGRVWDGGTARQLGLVDQFGGLDDALAWVAGQAKLKDGDWHPLYLGQNDGGYESLLEKLMGDDDSAPPAEDLVGVFAERREAVLGRALAGVDRLLGVRGAQAYCLECPVQAGAPERVKPGEASGWLRVLGWLKP